MTDDPIRRYFPDVADQLDSLKTGTEMLSQKLDAQATAALRAELEQRQKKAAEDARLDRDYPDNRRAVTIDTGYFPSRKINKGKDENGEPVWYNLYAQTVEAEKKAGPGQKR